MVEEEEEGMDWLKEILHDYKGEIGSILRAFAKNVEKGPLFKLGTLIAGLLIIVVLIGVIAYLSILGIISGDAVAFLIGAIAGYLFSFLRQHIIGVSG